MKTLNYPVKPDEAWLTIHIDNLKNAYGKNTVDQALYLLQCGELTDLHTIEGHLLNLLANFGEETVHGFLRDIYFASIAS